jgi:hypothetical protein
VAHTLPWTRREKSMDELDTTNQGMAAMETKAHLELLVARGQATRDVTDEGIALFMAVSAVNEERGSIGRSG